MNLRCFRNNRFNYSLSQCQLRLNLFMLLSFLPFLFNSDPRVLEAYNYTDVILKLPGGKRIRDIKWLSVWCRRFTVSKLQRSILIFERVLIPSFLHMVLLKQNLTVRFKLFQLHNFN